MVIINKIIDFCLTSCCFCPCQKKITKKFRSTKSVYIDYINKEKEVIGYND